MHRAIPVLLLLLATPAAADDRTLFVIDDPAGDDHGNGELIYPVDAEIEPGDLDLLRFEARRGKEGTTFRATFARPIRQPGPGAGDDLGTPRDRMARHGFYTFNLDLYIDTDRQPGVGNVAMLPGRRAEVAPTHAWEKTVVLTPRPHALRASIKRLRVAEWKEQTSRKRSISRGEARQHKKQVSEELLPLVFFPTQVRTQGRTVEFFVPQAFLGGDAQPDWSYVVVVSGALLEQRYTNRYFSKYSQESYDGLIRPVVPGSDSQAFGGGREGEPLQPPILDILTPPGDDQTRILDDFDSFQKRPAQVPGVVPAEL